MSGGARILALVTDAFGSGGGIAQYNRDFTAALAADPHIGRIDILPRLRPRPMTALPGGARQHRPSRRPIPYSVRAVAMALRLTPDIVFCGHLFMAPLAALVAWLVDARLVIQTHGVEVWPRPTWLQRWAVERADLVLCVSRDTRARILTWTRAAPDAVAVAPNTVGPAFTPGDGAAMRAELGVADRRVLVSVSRLDPGQRYKGQDRVIALLPALRRRGHDAVFLIGGAGDDAARLAALAREHGVEEHVRLLGEVPQARLADLYRAADLYLMPSASEGFGIVFLEAMACGAPALGLAAGGAPDALGRGLGEAVAPADLLDAIDRALRAPRPNAAHQCAEVRRRYGQNAFQARIAGLFARLTEAAPAAPAASQAA